MPMKIKTLTANGENDVIQGKFTSHVTLFFSQSEKIGGSKGKSDWQCEDRYG